MSLIRHYLVRLAKDLRPGADLAGLDYGCGAGELIEIAKAEGVSCLGVDAFYEGGSYIDQVKERGWFESVVYSLSDEGSIPFPADSFDVVFANQVFEHIDNWQTPLAEIDRVLKPGGVFINAFPTIEVWREGHCGVPFAHRMKGRRQYLLIRTARLLGLGANTAGRPQAEWTRNTIKWLDRWCFYKRNSDAEALFVPYYEIDNRDGDYLLWRMHANRLARNFVPLFRLPGMPEVAAFLSRRLGGRIFVLAKRSRADDISVLADGT